MQTFLILVAVTMAVLWLCLEAFVWTLATRSLLALRHQPDPQRWVAPELVPPERRAVGERRLLSAMAGQPGWQLHGWYTDGSSHTLVAGNGWSVMFCGEASSGSHVLVVAGEHQDGVRFGVTGHPAATALWIMPDDEDSYRMVERPIGYQFAVFGALATRRPIRPIPDPMAFMVERHEEDFRKLNTTPGRYIDETGCGRMNVRGALTMIWRMRTSKMQASLANRRTDAFMRRNGFAIP